MTMAYRLNSRRYDTVVKMPAKVKVIGLCKKIQMGPVYHSYIGPGLDVLSLRYPQPALKHAIVRRMQATNMNKL